jgi:hypothetical protein
LGPQLSSSCPNSGEFVGFWAVRHPSARRSGNWVALSGELVQPRGRCGASLLVGVAASGHVPYADVLCGRLVSSGPPCLVEELSCAPPRHPTSSERWDVGATWSRSVRGGATALGACGSMPLMIAGGPKESRIPSSPVRRRARSGWRAWWKVERRLDSLSVVP